ncbi:MAG: MlaD family protein [Solirubrobacterales bacterium]
MRRLLGGEARSEFAPAAARTAALGALMIAVIAVAVIVTRPYGTYQVNAVFEDTRGLIEGGEVTAGFQKVGSVQDITLGDDGLPHVRMKIDGDYVLHRGASADIRLTSNVGAVNRVVELEKGDPQAPRLGDGATLGPSSTDQPVDLDQAVSTLDPKTRADAARLLAGLDAATRGRGDDLDRLLHHSSGALNETANVLGEVGSDEQALRSLVADTSTVVGALARRPGDLGSAAERTATLLRIAGNRQAELRRSVAAIGPAFASGHRTLLRLDAAVPELRGLVRESLPVVYRLGPVADRLPTTIRALRPTLAQTWRLVRAAPRQARRLLPAVKAAIPLLGELSPTLGQFNPVLDHLRVRAPEVVSFFTLGADAIANYDVNGHLIRFIPRLIPIDAHGNPIGPSDKGPGSVVRPFDRTPGSLEGDAWGDYASSFIGGGQAVGAYTP